LYIFYYTTNQSSIFVKKKKSMELFCKHSHSICAKNGENFCQSLVTKKILLTLPFFLLMRCEKIQCKNRKNHHVKIFDLLKKIKTPLPKNCTILLKKLFPQFDEKPLRSHRKTQFFQKINPEIIIFCLIFLGPTKVKESLT